jgi:DNA-binding NtrC family response regulator
MTSVWVPTWDEGVGRELLEAISHAVRVLEGGGDDEQALRESFRMASRGLGAERSFLARLDARGWVSEVLEWQGLTGDEVAAVKRGHSSPGLSVSLVRRVVASRRVEHLEDTRLLVSDLERTGSLRNGDWSVVCAPVMDVETRLPAAVVYFQTHSLIQPLRASVVPHVRSYALALACTWQAWRQEQRRPRVSRDELSRGSELLGASSAMQALRRHLDTLILPAMKSPRPDPILIQGETGTGKGVVARYLHAHSPRARGPFVTLNGATLKGDLAEKTLFGHVKGSYTGASNDFPGAFVQAHGGVLFLDEIGDMPPEGQALLLLVTEARSVRPVGGTSEKPVDVQVMFATHVDLAAAQRAGRFRTDLYHRISALRVALAPLRERREDIGLLAEHLLAAYEHDRRRPTGGFTDEALDELRRYAWPGNVRQLEKACRRLSLRTSPGEAISVRAVQGELAALEREGHASVASTLADVLRGSPCSWEEAETHMQRLYIERVGEATAWNRSAMARWMRVERKTLYRMLKRCGLEERHMGGAEDDDDA